MKNKLLIILLIHLIVHPTQSQIKKDKSYYEKFDKLIGIENTGIFDGTLYKRKYKTLPGENNEFFKNKDFSGGNIIYKNQPYFDIQIKYDLFHNDIIVKIPQKNNFFIYKLNKSKVKYFSIDFSKFKRVLIDKTDLFYQVILEDKKLEIYKENKKKINTKLIKNNRIYFKFNKEKRYFIKFKNKYHIIKSKKTFIKLFPTLDKQINNFYKKNATLLKNSYDSFLNDLGKYLVPFLNKHQ